MASRTRARLNNLNDRAREVGRPASETLTLDDLDALRHFYNHTCLKCSYNPAISPDHVKPLSIGGTNLVENLQLLCDDCNKQKQDQEIDYRQGKVLTRELANQWIQENKQSPQENTTKQTYKKHDWNKIRFAYESRKESTLDSVADEFGAFRTLVYKRSAAEGWRKSKEIFGRELVERAENDVKEAVSADAIRKELSARGLLFDVIESAVEEWQNKPRATLGELAQLLKLGLAAQNVPTERTVVTDDYDEYGDDDIIEAASRIARRADRQASERDIGRSAPDEDGFGAGWSD